MKKTYTKPAFYVESFALTQNIARTCEGVTHAGNEFGTKNYNDPSDCQWILNAGGMTVFDTTKGCTYGDGEIEGFCYQNPEGGIMLFGS